MLDRGAPAKDILACADSAVFADAREIEAHRLQLGPASGSHCTIHAASPCEAPVLGLEVTDEGVVGAGDQGAGLFAPS